MVKVLDSANIISENASPSSFLGLAARRRSSLLNESNRKQLDKQTMIGRFKSPLTKRAVNPFEYDKSHDVIT